MDDLTDPARTRWRAAHRIATLGEDMDPLDAMPRARCSDNRTATQ